MLFLNLPINNHIIDLGGFIVLAVIIIGVVFKLLKGELHRFYLWQPVSIPDGSHTRPMKANISKVISSFFKILVLEVLGSKVHITCNKARWIAHLAVFWGFVFNLVSTALAALTNPYNLALPFTNLVKVFGNLGGVLLIAGTVAMFFLRYQENGSPWTITKADFFILALFFTGVTGMLLQIVIYTAQGPWIIAIYFWAHIIALTVLLITAPFTKFNHAIYKPVWLFYEELGKKAGEEQLLPNPQSRGE